MIDQALLWQMFPNAGARLAPHLPYIGEALEFGEITTPLRQAAFLAQLAHESGEYRYMEELASGEDYEGRTDLGNTEPGDGVRFKGHGPIQITGRANHKACGAFLGLNLIADPTLITTPRYGTMSAAWFWKEAKPWLNRCADRGWFKVTTRLINGGLNGWDDRQQYYQRNLRLLDLPLYEPSAETRSIREFQAAHGLAVDGDAGPRTLAALLS